VVPGVDAELRAKAVLQVVPAGAIEVHSVDL
jgi:hypothetical protein